MPTKPTISAILDYNKVLSQYPANQDALMARAYSRIVLDKYAEAYTWLLPVAAKQNSDALTNFTKSLDLKNAAPYLVYTNRDKAYVNLRLYDHALADYRQALLL